MKKKLNLLSLGLGCIFALSLGSCQKAGYGCEYNAINEVKTNNNVEICLDNSQETIEINYKPSNYIFHSKDAVTSAE